MAVAEHWIKSFSGIQLVNELLWEVQESFTHWSGALVGRLEAWAQLGLWPKVPAHGPSSAGPSGSLDFYMVTHGFKTEEAAWPFISNGTTWKNDNAFSVLHCLMQDAGF